LNGDPCPSFTGTFNHLMHAYATSSSVLGERSHRVNLYGPSRMRERHGATGVPHDPETGEQMSGG
ncbi:hypothetical protein CSC62_17370, partial [Pseudoxanthomonas jiangsuensis]|uniref:hypothetical protein n=1 Tax=Pseudoxanthomonas jiangsuensis TaxID=619688 RepID=UPI001B8739DB